MKVKYRKAVFITAYRREGRKMKYLILRRKLHWTGWEFPKGGIEKNETPMQTVIRELKEETNLSPVSIKSHNVQGKYKYDKKYKDRQDFIGQTWKLFSVEVKKGKIKLDRKEHIAYKLLDFREALKILTWKNQKDCLGFVNKNLR
jgi:bis(5'-nucleosidyl)-tetraphosphatase